MPANPIIRFLARDPRLDGVRPVQMWGLRLFFLLMLVFVATHAWRVLLTHEGAWDPVRAVAFAVWATYPALALFGLLHPEAQLSRAEREELARGLGATLENVECEGDD